MENEGIPMKALPVIILSILLLLNQGYMENLDSQQNDLNYTLDNQLSKAIFTNVATPVIHDGLISEGEYNYSVLIDSGKNFWLYYSVNASVVYFAMVADVLGYLTIGFNDQPKMFGSDVVIGYVSDQAYMQDSWGSTATNIINDTVDNILSFAGSENTTSTVLEFSRNLDIVNATEDFALPVDSEFDLIWAFHKTNDDLTSIHSSRGNLKITLNSGTLPTDVTLEIKEDHILASWFAPLSISADNYSIYRSVTSGSGYTLIGSSVNTNYEDAGFIKSSENFYVITALSNLGESGISTEVSVIVPADPVTPTEFNAIGGENKISLSWTDTIIGAELIHYRLFRSSTSGGEFVNFVNSTGTSYIDTDVQAGETWHYKISSVNVLGESELSNSIDATVNEDPTTTPTTNQTTDPDSPILPYFAIAGALIVIVATFVILRKLNQ